MFALIRQLIAALCIFALVSQSYAIAQVGSTRIKRRFENLYNGIIDKFILAGTTQVRYTITIDSPSDISYDESGLQINDKVYKLNDPEVFEVLKKRPKTGTTKHLVVTGLFDVQVGHNFTYLYVKQKDGEEMENVTYMIPPPGFFYGNTQEEINRAVLVDLIEVALAVWVFEVVVLGYEGGKLMALLGASVVISEALRSRVDNELVQGEIKIGPRAIRSPREISRDAFVKAVAALRITIRDDLDASGTITKIQETARVFEGQVTEGAFRVADVDSIEALTEKLKGLEERQRFVNELQGTKFKWPDLSQVFARIDDNLERYRNEFIRSYKTAIEEEADKSHLLRFIDAPEHRHEIDEEIRAIGAEVIINSFREATNK